MIIIIKKLPLYILNKSDNATSYLSYFFLFIRNRKVHKEERILKKMLVSGNNISACLQRPFQIKRTHFKVYGFLLCKYETADLAFET